MASEQLECHKQETSNDEHNLNVSKMGESDQNEDSVNMPENDLAANIARMPLDANMKPTIVKTEENDQCLENSMDYTDQEDFFMPAHFLSQTLTHSDSDEESMVNCALGASAETLYTLTHTYDTGRKRVRYSCNVCEKDFKDKRECIRHIRVHTGEKPFSCYICGDRFAREDYLSRHIESHNPDRPFPCTKCNKAFAKKATLTQHLLTHTDKSKRPYPCSICDSAFVKRSHLDRHMKTHTASRDFICTECGKAFLEKRRMLDHFTRLHAERVLPSCEICHKEFRWEHLLRRHMKAYHNSSAQKTEDQLLEIEENLPIFVSKAERELKANQQNPSIEASDSHSLFGNVGVINDELRIKDNGTIPQNSDTVTPSTLAYSSNEDISTWNHQFNQSSDKSIGNN